MSQKKRQKPEAKRPDGLAPRRHVAISEEERRAIQLTIDLGRRLKGDLPETAIMYRLLIPQVEIVKALRIERNYRVTFSIAVNAVSRALRGYDGQMGGRRYDGLIGENEMDELLAARKSQTGTRMGLFTAEQKLGIHALSDSERSDIGRRMGVTSFLLGRGIHAQTFEERQNIAKMGGNATYDRKVGIHAYSRKERQEAGLKGAEALAKLGRGIHALSPEERTANAWKSIRKRAERRGLPLLSEPVGDRISELDYAIGQSALSENQYKSGNLKGRPDWGLITHKLNQEYHGGKPVRSRGTIKISVYKKQGKTA